MPPARAERSTSAGRGRRCSTGGLRAITRPASCCASRDTDRERSSRESEEVILEALAWLGIDHDPVPGSDGIPRQSERAQAYREAASRLLDLGHAYRCTCSPERLKAMRELARAEGRSPGYDATCREHGIGADSPDPFCVRLKVPTEGGRTRWADLIAGPTGEDASQLDDFVIARTDGSAIYHLAVVVDDHEMGVTHVIRGREHMSSTPRQLLLYQALDLAPPEFAHVPLLVEPGGKKLSKRMEAASVLHYRDRGFTPEAVFNYLARLGWGTRRPRDPESRRAPSSCSAWAGSGVAPPRCTMTSSSGSTSTT